MKFQAPNLNGETISKLEDEAGREEANTGSTLGLWHWNESDKTRGSALRRPKTFKEDLDHKSPQSLHGTSAINFRLSRGSLKEAQA